MRLIFVIGLDSRELPVSSGTPMFHIRELVKTETLDFSGGGQLPSTARVQFGLLTTYSLMHYSYLER